MSSLPAPLVPSEVDLRDFPFMPLDVQRLRDSRLIATRSSDEIVAAILLWSASWHQQPAASLPDDDQELAHLSGYGKHALKEFKRVREGALHGWISCADGRLYHPVVAEKAAEAWNGRLESEWRRACDRTRKENKERKERGDPESVIPSRPALLSMQHENGIPSWNYKTSAGIPTERLRKSSLKGEGKGEGEGKGQLLVKTSPPSGAKPDPVKLEIWQSGKALLAGEGMSEERAGSYIGKLVKDFGQVLVLEAVRDATQTTPAKPSEWLMARCQERRKPVSKQAALEARNAAVAAAWSPPEESHAA